MTPGLRAVLRFAGLLGLALLSSPVARAGPPMCAPLGGAMPAFDPRDTRMSPVEAAYLEQLFEFTRAVATENRGVLRWLLSGPREGLHVDDHRARLDRQLASLDAVAAPERLAPVRALVVESIGAQRAFFEDWAKALAEGRPFESQLTSEFGWNEALDRSHRALLRAYTKLLALDPAESDANRGAFHAELCGLAIFGGAGR